MTEHVYGKRSSEFRKGDRVALHPADDRFMRGIRYGTVTRTRRPSVSSDGFVMAVMDNTGREDIFSPWKLRLMEPLPPPCTCEAWNHTYELDGQIRMVHSESCAWYDA